MTHRFRPVCRLAGATPVICEFAIAGAADHRPPRERERCPLAYHTDDDSARRHSPASL